MSIIAAGVLMAGGIAALLASDWAHALEDAADEVSAEEELQR